jgi:hypothetical protein
MKILFLSDVKAHSEDADMGIFVSDRFWQAGSTAHFTA